MITNYNDAVENISNQFADYLKKSKLKAVILGQSGGIDSALTAVLAKPVCDKLGVKLISRSISIVTNKADEEARAAIIGKHFIHDFAEVDLSEYFAKFAVGLMEGNKKADQSTLLYKLRQGNIKARMRMMYLYDLAQQSGGMVLSTDNYTELMLGFWTLHGDVGDYGLIQNLWKTEVYEMSRHLAASMNTEEANALLMSVDAMATDGLGISNGDLEQIQAESYEQVDQILIAYLSGGDGAKKYANHPVVLRKINSEYKRSNPYNIPRELISKVPLI